MGSYPRNRSRGSFVYATGASYQGVYCNGTYKDNLTGLYEGYQTGEVETCTDYVHGNYHKRKLAGEIMNTPIYKYKVTKTGINTSDYAILYSNPNITCTGTNLIIRMAGQKHLRNMKLSPGDGCTYDWWKELESRQTDVIAGTKAWGGINPAQIQGTVLAAELGKTFSMLLNPLSSMKKYLQRLKKSKRYRTWSKARKLARQSTDLASFISEYWLMYRYGIMPIIYDIQGIKKILNDPFVSPRQTSRASEEFGSGRLTYTSPYSEGTAPALGYVGSTVTTRTVNVRVSAGILYETECRLETKYGYGLDQQLSAIYELVPRSFILDWFVNLGDYIDAISPKIGVKVLAQWTTIKVTDTNTAEANATGGDTRQYYNYTGKLSATAVEVRQLYSRQPVAKCGLVNLTQSWDLGRTREQYRILDAISLVTTALRSR